MGQTQSSEEINKNDNVSYKCTAAKMNWDTISAICDKRQETDHAHQCEIEPSLLNSICKLNFNSGEKYNLSFSDGRPRPCNI